MYISEDKILIFFSDIDDFKRFQINLKEKIEKFWIISNLAQIDSIF
jgi:hypothetical protein